MEAADLRKGPQDRPEGLRHGFGVPTVTSGIPLNMARSLLGYTQHFTKTIHVDAIRGEDKSIASRMR